MRSDTQTISIDAPYRVVAAFVADPQNLPRWAVGFARSVRRDDQGWIVATGTGEMRLDVEHLPEHGIVDFRLTPAPGVRVLAASRVIPRGDGAEYVFTQFQAPGMPDEDFARSVRALGHELSVLKSIMEVECPV
jgi:hypothetical protein